MNIHTRGYNILDVNFTRAPCTCNSYACIIDLECETRRETGSAVMKIREKSSDITSARFFNEQLMRADRKLR